MLLMVMGSLLLSSCHQDEDEIFTNANIVLQVNRVLKSKEYRVQ